MGVAANSCHMGADICIKSFFRLSHSFPFQLIEMFVSENLSVSRKLEPHLLTFWQYKI